MRLQRINNYFNSTTSKNYPNKRKRLKVPLSLKHPRRNVFKQRDALFNIKELSFNCLSFWSVNKVSPERLLNGNRDIFCGISWLVSTGFLRALSCALIFR